MPDRKSERQARFARNEDLFRDVNENIAQTVATHTTGSGATSQDSRLLYEFVCECGHIECTQKIKLTHEEYESMRAVGERFALLAGHEAEFVEVVVARNDRFWVVEKIEEGKRVARALDNHTTTPK